MATVHEDRDEATTPEKRGRPRVRRDPDARVSVSMRLTGALFNQLDEIARINNRPLGLECEYRLQRSLDPPKTDRRAMTFDMIYERQGIAGLVRHLINVEANPDNDERVVRTALVRRAVTFPRVPAEWLEPDPDGPTVTIGSDDEGNPVIVEQPK
jgi:hypothetical protein